MLTYYYKLLLIVWLCWGNHTSSISCHVSQTVIPLNETTGIIEWINNLQPLRNILLKLYKEKLGKNMMRHEEIRWTEDKAKFGSTAQKFCFTNSSPVIRNHFIKHFFGHLFFKHTSSLHHLWASPLFILNPSICNLPYLITFLLMPVDLCTNTSVCLKINQYSTGLFVSYSQKNLIACMK